MHITLGQAILLPDQTCEVNRMVFFTSRGAASTETAVGDLDVGRIFLILPFDFKLTSDQIVGVS